MERKDLHCSCALLSAGCFGTRCYALAWPSASCCHPKQAPQLQAASVTVLDASMSVHVALTCRTASAGSTAASHLSPPMHSHTQQFKVNPSSPAHAAKAGLKHHIGKLSHHALLPGGQGIQHPALHPLLERDFNKRSLILERDGAPSVVTLTLVHGCAWLAQNRAARSNRPIRHLGHAQQNFEAVSLVGFGPSLVWLTGYPLDIDASLV